MPNFTLTLTQTAVDKLQAVVTRTNDNICDNLTLLQWMTLHLQEVAIADQLAAAVTAVQEQHQRDAQTALDAALRTVRDELLAEL